MQRGTIMAKVNDTREVMRSNAAIKAQLNADAHAERMATYDALYEQTERLVVRLVEAKLAGDKAQEAQLGVLLTSQRAVLRHHVQQMSSRIKLRGT